MLYTSYFANWRNFKELVQVSISLKPPNGYKGLGYKKLAPSSSILFEYKTSPDEVRYYERFTREILSNMDPHKIVKELMNLSLGKDVVLLCYEKPTDFCHRHIVANWLREAGYDVKECLR